MQEENTQQVVRLGKFAASKRIVSESLAIVRQDKEVLLFPVLSIIVTFFATIIMAVFFFFVFLGGAVVNGSFEMSKEMPSVFGYIVLFVNYLVVMFIANFFQAGLFVIVKGRFDGQDLSFSDGIAGAMKKLGKIFMWSAVSATVGIILRIIADKSKLLGKILAMVLGAAWNILTFFSLPALVINEVGVIGAFKESASVIRKKWGETIIINFGVGLLFFFIHLFLLMLFIVSVIVSPSLITIALGGGLLLIAVIVLSILALTLSSIFKLAIFIYAQNGTIPKGFSRDLIVGAVEKVEA